MNKRKRVCFICLTNQFLTPYLDKYISVIDCEYDIIFWNRHGLNEKSGAGKQYSYNLPMSENASKLKKSRGYLGFSRFAKRIIKQNKYDGIILTPTNSGMLLRSTLLRYYKGRYVVDIRDYTMEENPLFYLLEKKLLENSALNVISSEGYKHFLPKNEYTIVHNEIDIPAEIVNKFRYRNKVKGKIVLTNIGLIRFLDQNKKIIDIFCNDPRFEVRFIGANAFALKDYCESKRANNIVLIDRFPPEKTLELLWGTDMLLNLYGNNTPLLDYALSNKLYYAAKLGLPILVCPNTYMEEVSIRYGFGYSFDLGKQNIDINNLVDYYNTINWYEFYSKCDNFLAKVQLEMKLFEERIKRFIGNL